MPSDLETAVRWSKKLEALLEQRLGARGRGLHEKTDSVADTLDAQTVRALRVVATVRNKIVHEDGYDRIRNKKKFRDACRTAERGLRTRRGIGKPAVFAVVGTLVVIAAAIVLMRVL